MQCVHRLGPAPLLLLLNKPVLHSNSRLAHLCGWLHAAKRFQQEQDQAPVACTLHLQVCKLGLGLGYMSS